MAVIWPLVGREQQLASIAAAMGSSTTHGVVVVGASGLGKTRLATEALRRAAARGAAHRLGGRHPRGREHPVRPARAPAAGQRR